MEEGIAITQQSNFAWSDVEFAEGEEPGIPDGKAYSSISEWIVTAFLSFVVIKSIIQGILIRGKKLSQILLHDDLLHLNTHGSTGGGGRERVI